MIESINKIPVFVWPLFTILLLSGLKARKTSQIPLSLLFLIPLIFSSWSLFSFFGKYAADPLAIVFWFICLGLGFIIGFSHMQTLKLQFDRKKKKVELPGSWIPLMLSMSIFSSKFLIGIMSAILFESNGSAWMLWLELFSAIILGVFLGRGINCLMRYKNSEVEYEI